MNFFFPPTAIDAITGLEATGHTREDAVNNLKKKIGPPRFQLVFIDQTIHVNGRRLMPFTWHAAAAFAETVRTFGYLNLPDLVIIEGVLYTDIGPA